MDISDFNTTHKPIRWKEIEMILVETNILRPYPWNLNASAFEPLQKVRA
jgi:hypothetical protein